MKFIIYFMFLSSILSGVSHTFHSNIIKQNLPWNFGFCLGHTCSLVFTKIFDVKTIFCLLLWPRWFSPQKTFDCRVKRENESRTHNGEWADVRARRSIGSHSSSLVNYLLRARQCIYVYMCYENAFNMKGKKQQINQRAGRYQRSRAATYIERKWMAWQFSTREWSVMSL
jgi:hypothetical protein